jgi:hypothetical protein
MGCLDIPALVSHVCVETNQKKVVSWSFFPYPACPSETITADLRSPW